MYKFSGYLTELVLEKFYVQRGYIPRGQAVFRTLQDQWFDMRVHNFAGSVSEKHAHSKQNFLNELFFLLACLEIRIFLCIHPNKDGNFKKKKIELYQTTVCHIIWHKICVALGNLLAFFPVMISSCFDFCDLMK